MTSVIPCPSLRCILCILPALRFILPYPALPAVLLCPTLLFSILADPVLSYPVLFLPCPTLPNITLPCLALPCRAMIFILPCFYLSSVPVPISVSRLIYPFLLSTLHCRCYDLLCHDLLSALPSHLICPPIYCTALSVCPQLCPFP